jgi:hypothetical protein
MCPPFSPSIQECFHPSFIVFRSGGVWPGQVLPSKIFCQAAGSTPIDSAGRQFSFVSHNRCKVCRAWIDDSFVLPRGLLLHKHIFLCPGIFSTVQWFRLYIEVRDQGILKSGCERLGFVRFFHFYMYSLILSCRRLILS